ncbi:MAG: hypothetical protein KatS3mg038_3636 [Candidatus Kapaibacterium sp.]|nr:MAG: hypothetical protein KatS3mg038_3636 [Candidatus Kapabacteria bacterium]
MRESVDADKLKNVAPDVYEQCKQDNARQTIRTVVAMTKDELRELNEAAITILLLLWTMLIYSRMPVTLCAGRRARSGNQWTHTSTRGLRPPAWLCATTIQQILCIQTNCCQS